MHRAPTSLITQNISPHSQAGFYEIQATFLCC